MTSSSNFFKNIKFKNADIVCLLNCSLRYELVKRNRIFILSKVFDFSKGYLWIQKQYLVNSFQLRNWEIKNWKILFKVQQIL